MKNVQLIFWGGRRRQREEKNRYTIVPSWCIKIDCVLGGVLGQGYRGVNSTF